MAGTVRAVLDWLERVFFGGMELSVLSSPGFLAVLVLQQRYPDAAALAGLTAIAAGSVAIAVSRAGTVDTGEWPRRAELTSLPLRLGYFSSLFLVASIGVAAVSVRAGSLWLTPLGGVVQAAGIGAFPAVYGLVHGEPVKNPVEGL